MKNSILNLGKALSKAEQMNILGGGASITHVGDNHWTSDLAEGETGTPICRELPAVGNTFQPFNVNAVNGGGTGSGLC